MAGTKYLEPGRGQRPETTAKVNRKKRWIKKKKNNIKINKQLA